MRRITDLALYHRFLKNAGRDESCLDNSCQTISEAIYLFLLLMEKRPIAKSDKADMAELCERLALVNNDLKEIKSEYLQKGGAA